MLFRSEQLQELVQVLATIFDIFLHSGSPLRRGRYTRIEQLELFFSVSRRLRVVASVDEDKSYAMLSNEREHATEDGYDEPISSSALLNINTTAHPYAKRSHEATSK